MMKITPLKLIVAGLVLAVVLLTIVMGRATRTTGGGVELVTDSKITVTVVGKLGGYRLFRVDDHGRGVTCYAAIQGGMDCDRSFYERR